MPELSRVLSHLTHGGHALAEDLYKAEPAAAKALLRELEATFQPRPLKVAGLELHRYLGGPWERVGRWSFRG